MTTIFPPVDAPEKEGYSFKGYFTEKDGKGKQIYNEFMATDIVYTYDDDITLYAYWMDDVPPQLTFTADYDIWTKNEVTLTAEAFDYGRGLRELKIFRLNIDESENEVAKISKNGEKELILTCKNTREGIVRYRAIAVDLDGNTVKAYAVAYYDTKAPIGLLTEVKDNFGKMKLKFDVTDMNTGV